MPINHCESNGKPGFRYGNHGKCYTYTEGSEASKKAAKEKAILQGVAVRSTGWKEPGK